MDTTLTTTGSTYRVTVTDGFVRLNGRRLTPAEAQALSLALDQAAEALLDEAYGPEVQGCECELDWNCPLHRGGYTALERQLDAWASTDREAF